MIGWESHKSSGFLSHGLVGRITNTRQQFKEVTCRFEFAQLFLTLSVQNKSSGTFSLESENLGSAFESALFSFFDIHTNLHEQRKIQFLDNGMRYNKVRTTSIHIDFIAINLCY